MTDYVYLVTNLVNGKKYVGQTKLIPKRWGEHLSAARRGVAYPLYRAMRKYGVENFTVECLETVTSGRSDLLAAEVRQIAFHDCKAPKGYNLTPGGEGVDLSVPGVRERMREGARKRSADPAYLANLREGIRRRSADPEWRRNQTAEHRRPCTSHEWRGNMKAGAVKRAADPEWQRKCKVAREMSLPRATTASSAAAVARDAHLPVEERLRRAHRREKQRLAAARRAALVRANPDPN